MFSFHFDSTWRQARGTAAREEHDPHLLAGFPYAASAAAGGDVRASRLASR